MAGSAGSLDPATIAGGNVAYTPSIHYVALF